GFDGYAKTEVWSPVRVQATNNGPPVEGEIRLTTDYPGDTYARPLSLPTGAQKEVTLFVILRGSGRYTLQFVSDDGTTLYHHQKSPRQFPPYNLMVGVVSPSGSLLNFLAGMRNLAPSGDTPIVVHLSLAELPEEAAALSALNVLVFNDVETASLTSAQRTALAGWVSQGGTLIVGGGPDAAATTAGLAELLPVTGLTIQTFDRLDGLSRFARRTIPNQGPYLAAIPGQTFGMVDLYEQGKPFLVRRPVGQGQVIYFALDFGLAPMDGWAGNESFWSNLLQDAPILLPMDVAYETSHNIHDSLANLPFAGVPSPWALLTFLCSYLMAVVPLNYFVLKRMRRQEWAWFTIPSLILLFTLGGYLSGFQVRGQHALLRQISIARQVSGASSATVDTFLGLYSPRRAPYTLHFQEGVLVHPTEGGNGFRGVKRTSSAPTTVRYGSPTELRNLWTDIGSMSTAVAQTHTEALPIYVNLRLQREGRAWRVTGVIQNQSNQTLQDAMLIAGNWGVRLPALEPGEQEINKPLSSLYTDTYSRQTLWGTSYYQIDDPQIIANDQIVRGIFWPGYVGPFNSQPGNNAGNTPGNLVTLVGWGEEDIPEARVTVSGGRVDYDRQNLWLIRAPFLSSTPTSKAE
ncbi:MAG: hypothetical protein D6796_07115, partial [Caldilineae bacterium]